MPLATVSDRVYSSPPGPHANVSSACSQGPLLGTWEGRARGTRCPPGPYWAQGVLQGTPILHATQPSPQQGTTPHPNLSTLLLIFEFCAFVSLQQNTEQHSLRMNLLGSCGAGPTAQREKVEKSGLPHG